MLNTITFDSLKKFTSFCEEYKGPVWLSGRARLLKIIHLRVQFDIDILEHLQQDVYLYDSHVLFLNQTDRDLYETWASKFDESKAPTHILMPFSITDILAKGPLHVTANVPYELESLDNNWLYTNHTELVRWVYKRTHREKDNDVWYDRNGNQFLFQNPNTAMEFKLKFLNYDTT